MDSKHKQTGKTVSSSSSIPRIFLTLALLLGLTVALIYYLGTNQVHDGRLHPLAAVFKTDMHQALISQLKLPENRRVVVEGTAFNGVFHFLKHYAALRTQEGKTVVLKELRDDIYSAFITEFHQYKKSIDDCLGFGRDPNVEVLVFIEQQSSSFEWEIERIVENYPQNRIIVGVMSPQEFTGFTKIIFENSIRAEIVEKQMEDSLKISKKEAMILRRYAFGPNELLTLLKEAPYSRQNVLGEFYNPLEGLTAEEEKLLSDLCAKGQIEKPEQGFKKFEKMGVFFYRYTGYWKYRQNRLNYELIKQVECVEKEAPKVFIKMTESKEFAEQQRQKTMEAAMRMREESEMKIKNTEL